MSVFTEIPYPTLSFGDLCGGFPWFDASLRVDATALQIQEAPKRFAEKRGVDRIDFFVPVDGNGVPPPKNTDYLLAHGQTFEEAVCVSDDCVIETALGRDGKQPRGQLLFAPVTELEGGEAEALERNLRRHPLGDGRVIELHRTFRVRSMDIADLDHLTRSSLTEAARAELAMRWAAHVCRTGPMVAMDNADKLAQLLIQKEGWPEPRAAAVAQALVNVAATGWRLETNGLENAGNEHDRHRNDLQAADLSAAIAPLRESLEQLRDSADEALSALPKGGVQGAIASR